MGIVKIHDFFKILLGVCTPGAQAIHKFFFLVSFLFLFGLFSFISFDLFFYLFKFFHCFLAQIILHQPLVVTDSIFYMLLFFFDVIYLLIYFIVPLLVFTGGYIR